MRLFYYEDLSLAEISGIKGITRQAVNAQVHRAADKLREFERGLKLVRAYERTKELQARLGAAVASKSWAEAESVLIEWKKFEEPKDNN